MKLQAGNIYFVSDRSFEKVKDPFLKINYKTTKRPHYLAFQDTATFLFWLVIKIVKIQNQKTALLFQDMFPTTKSYITEPYIRGGQPFYIADPKVVAELEKMHKR